METPPSAAVDGTVDGSGTGSGGAGGALGPDAGKGPIATHPELSNTSTISSEHGTPDGDVVVSQPLSGPIVALDEFGLVGRSKGALKPFAARTEGRPGSGPSLPLGNEQNQSGPQVVLSRQSTGDLRKAESSLGTPLFSEKGAVTEGMKGRLKELASGAVGDGSKARMEHLKANPLDKDKWGNKKGPFSIEGPLKYRKILKMELPPYPRWAEEKAIEAAVSIRLWVDSKGIVKDNMYLEKTSGYNELDYLAKEALMKFIFVPIPKDQTQEDEWGVATFRFELVKGKGR
jgi:TonB family protein